jgi:thioesterase DpgC
VNEVLPAAEMDAAVQRLAAEVADSGIVSAGANRKAIRMGVEPLELFRQYMALYSRIQGDCHFSQTLVDNLKKHWISRNNSGA